MAAGDGDGLGGLGGWRLGRNFEVVHQDVGVVDRCRELVGEHHLAVDEELEVVCSGLEVEGCGEGIFVLAGAAVGVLALCR